MSVKCCHKIKAADGQDRAKNIRRHARHKINKLYVLFDVTINLVNYHVPFPPDFDYPDFEYFKEVLSRCPNMIVRGKLPSGKRIGPACT
jgi:hypothetical protein